MELVEGTQDIYAVETDALQALVFVYTEEFNSSTQKLGSQVLICTHRLQLSRSTSSCCVARHTLLLLECCISLTINYPSLSLHHLERYSRASSVPLFIVTLLCSIISFPARIIHMMFELQLKSLSFSCP